MVTKSRIRYRATWRPNNHGNRYVWRANAHLSDPSTKEFAEDLWRTMDVEVRRRHGHVFNKTSKETRVVQHWPSLDRIRSIEIDVSYFEARDVYVTFRSLRNLLRGKNVTLIPRRATFEADEEDHEALQQASLMGCRIARCLTFKVQRDPFGHLHGPESIELIENKRTKPFLSKLTSELTSSNDATDSWTMWAQTVDFFELLPGSFRNDPAVGFHSLITDETLLECNYRVDHEGFLKRRGELLKQYKQDLGAWHSSVQANIDELLAETSAE